MAGFWQCSCSSQRPHATGSGRLIALAGDKRHSDAATLQKARWEGGHENGVLGCGAYPRTPCRPIFDRPLQDAVLCGVTLSELISVEGKQLVVSVRDFKIG